MQSFDSGGAVMLSFYCKDPSSTTTSECATFYRTNRSTWIVQGDERAAEDVTAQLVGFKPTETAVEIPEALVELLVGKYAKERYGVDLRETARGTA